MSPEIREPKLSAQASTSRRNLASAQAAKLDSSTRTESLRVSEIISKNLWDLLKELFQILENAVEMFCN